MTAQLATEGTETVETTASLSAEDLIDDKSRVLITDRTITVGPKTLVLRPPTMMVGVGCRRGTEAQLISQAIESALKTAGRSPKSVVGAASVIVKADEAGLLEAMKTLDWPIQFYEQDDMKAVIAAMKAEGLIK